MKLYTIGYSGYDITDFITELKDNDITCLIDVRSLPESSYYKNYNRDILEKILKKNNILYRNYRAEFGAWQLGQEYYSELSSESSTLFLDFEKFTESEKFNNGVNRVLKGMEMGFCFVLMCSEKNPIECHRNIMVARAFHKKGVEVINLLPNQEKISQTEIENKLLKTYFPDQMQLSFDIFESTLTKDQKINMAYREANKKIGNKITK